MFILLTTYNIEVINNGHISTYADRQGTAKDSEYIYLDGRLRKTFRIRVHELKPSKSQKFIGNVCVELLEEELR